MASGAVVQSSSSAGASSAQGHQALKVITGHKTAALFAQVIAEPSLAEIKSTTLFGVM